MSDKELNNGKRKDSEETTEDHIPKESEEISSKRRKTDEFSPSRTPSKSFEPLSGVVTLVLVADAAQPPLATNQIASITVSDSEANPTVLGRNNDQLSSLLDAFTSRIAATVVSQRSGSNVQIAMSVCSSNPMRLTSNGTKRILNKGDKVVLQVGDIVELTYNKNTGAAKYPFVVQGSIQKSESAILPKKLFSDTETSVAKVAPEVPKNEDAERIVPMEEEKNEIKDWILSLGNSELASYIPTLLKEGFTTMDTISLLTSEDLAELGFKMAHRKKFLSAIKAYHDKTHPSAPAAEQTPEPTVPEVTPKAQVTTQAFSQNASQISPVKTDTTHSLSASKDSSTPEKVDTKSLQREESLVEINVNEDTHDKHDIIVEAPTPKFKCSVCKDKDSCLRCPACITPNGEQEAKNAQQQLKSDVESNTEPKSSEVKDDKELTESKPQEAKPVDLQQQDTSPSNTSTETESTKRTEGEEAYQVDTDDEDFDTKDLTSVINTTKEEDPSKFAYYCFECSMAAHKGIPTDDPKLRHNIQVVDQELLSIQRQEIEDRELKIEMECIKAAQQSLHQLSEVIKLPLGTQSRMEAFAKDLSAISKKCVLPETSIVVMGDTGAGKSSTLNAILGEESILPTNGMRACTAVIIEMRYNKKGPGYIGEIEFLSKEEWLKELTILFQDLHGEDGQIIKKPDPRSQAGIALAKIKVVYGNIKITEQSMGMFSRMSNKIVSALGTTQLIQETNPERFRRAIEQYADSTNVKTDLAYWPLVKRIKLYGPWDALRSGATLVDAPGVRDDNSARDAVVKSYLRDGNSIWIVASIKRAVDDKTAKDMLGEGFRRQLLMDGQYGSLAFIATHADILNRTEIIRNLGLPPDSTKLECALARNFFTKQRIKEDFKAGLEEMAINSGNDKAVESLQQFYLPVFTVSSMDFQKLIGNYSADGRADTFSSIEDTEIPALRRYLYEVTLRRRTEAMHSLFAQLQHYISSVKHFLLDEGTVSADIRDRTKVLFRESCGKFVKMLSTYLLNLRATIEQTIKDNLYTKIPEGVRKAIEASVAAIMKWGAPINKAERSQGGLHWSTYKATVRRQGAYASSSAGNINMNEDLAEPIFRQISVNWDKLFGVQLKDIFTAYQKELIGLLRKFCSEFGDSLVKLGVSTERINRNTEHTIHDQNTKLTNALDGILTQIQEEQKNISRLIPPDIQQSMTPAYDAAAAASGPGSYMTMKLVMQQHVEKQRVEMFNNASKVLTTGLTSLLGTIYKEIEKMHQQIIYDLTFLNQTYWEIPVVNSSAKKKDVLPLITVEEQCIQLAYSKFLQSKKEKVAITPQINTGNSLHDGVTSVPQTKVIDLT